MITCRPRALLTRNEHNVCGGVEFGFLSTSLGLEEALKYSESKTGEPSLVFQMQLGMVSKLYSSRASTLSVRVVSIVRLAFARAGQSWCIPWMA